LALSVDVSTHELLQACRPVWQPVVEQVPLEHTAVPVHVMPHPPQLLGSMLVGMQVPPQKAW
jgi:hypothetical protein